jgi:ATP-dependent RNA helicase DDX31/DBP7
MALDLSKIEYLVFDEADRMLDMDFEKKINFIIFKIHAARKKALAEPEIPKYKLDENGEPIEDTNVPSGHPTLAKRLDPQTILISATLTNGIKEIARRLNINDAIHIDADNRSKPLKRDEKIDDIEVPNTNNSDNQEEKIALPAGLSHFYMIVPSKLRLIGLISFILDKFVVSC